MTPRDPGLPVALLFFAFLAVGVLSLNVVRTTYGIKGDEATYVSMALSVAHDGDLAFQRQDLVRFWRIYQSGPEGIFLKRGQDLDVDLIGRWPFVQVTQTLERDTDRLYFGKAFAYSLAAAPFVGVAGLNGLLLFNVALLVGVFWCGYLFAAERMSRSSALLLSSGFLIGSVAPLYAVWLTPEIFNFSIVFYAYCLWLYKEVRAAPVAASTNGWRPSSDVVAAVLLGVATFSKPSNLPLVVPMIGLMVWRRQWRHGAKVACVFGAIAAGCFALNGIVSGELNYQGGERKTFYGQFPFETGDADFDSLGIGVSTNEIRGDESAPSFWRLLRLNSTYFLFGRHFGLLPYYFPGVVLIVWALWRRRRLTVWHAMIGGTVALTALGLLVLLPNTWSGGGGPLGNRYFFSIYATFFFLLPVTRSLAPGLIMWAGAALFTAHILVDPFVAAKRPWQNMQHGVFRWLPVELTMVNDLPVQLDRGRSRIPYDSDPPLLLYFLDDNAARPTESGIWVSGETRADLIVRTAVPLAELAVTLRAPVSNTATVTVDGTTAAVEVHPATPATIRLPVRGVYASGAQAFVLSIETDRGFVPHLRDPTSRDRRFLGVTMRLSGTPRAAALTP